MSGKRRFTAIVVLATVVFGGAVGLATASNQDVKAPTTVHVVLKHSVFQVVDNNGNKNIGDTFAFNARMWNAGAHRRIGYVDGACTATTADDSRALCSVVYTFLGRGEISTVGVSPLSGAADTDPIAGGDGEFRNVRGQVDFGNSTGSVIHVALELEP